jgi:hypothetical protein
MARDGRETTARLAGTPDVPSEKTSGSKSEITGKIRVEAAMDRERKALNQ